MALNVNTDVWGSPENWNTNNATGSYIKYTPNRRTFNGMYENNLQHLNQDIDLSIAPWYINKNSVLRSIQGFYYYNDWKLNPDNPVASERGKGLLETFKTTTPAYAPFIMSVHAESGETFSKQANKYNAYMRDGVTLTNAHVGNRYPITNFRYDKIKLSPVVYATGTDPSQGGAFSATQNNLNSAGYPQYRATRPYIVNVGFRIFADINGTWTQISATLDLDTILYGDPNSANWYSGQSDCHLLLNPYMNDYASGTNYNNWFFEWQSNNDMIADGFCNGEGIAKYSYYSFTSDTRDGVQCGLMPSFRFSERTEKNTGAAAIMRGLPWRNVASLADYNDFIEDLKRELAYIGLPFVIEQQDISEPFGSDKVYLPVFDGVDGEWVTTGEYKNGTESQSLMNASWQWVYDIELPTPPPPAPTIDPVEFYDEYNAEYLSALKQKHRRYKVRLELLGYYENVIGEITRDLSRGASGSITINNEQITRRSCSLSLINVEKKYLPSPDSPIWFNRKFKLWIGIVTGKHTYWWSYGVFFTTKATCDGATLNIQGIDKGGALDGTIKTGMLDAENVIERGTTLTNVIKDTLMWNEFSSPYLRHNTGASSYPVDPIAPIIDTKFDKITTQAEITINANDYISTLFSSIADGYGADAYYNTNGHFVFQTMADDSRIDGYRFMAHQWDFKDTDEMYSNASIEYNLDGFNVVTVYTNESTLENVSYTAANNNPASPLRLDSAGIRRMSDIEIPYVNVSQDEMQNRCKAYADYLLMKEAMDRMSLTFSCPIIPHLDVNRTIGVTDKRYNLESATFIINSITMPLSAESMTINATSTEWLPDDTSIEGGAD